MKQSIYRFIAVFLIVSCIVSTTYQGGVSYGESTDNYGYQSVELNDAVTAGESEISTSYSLEGSAVTTTGGVAIVESGSEDEIIESYSSNFSIATITGGVTTIELEDDKFNIGTEHDISNYNFPIYMSILKDSLTGEEIEVLLSAEYEFILKKDDISVSSMKSKVYQNDIAICIAGQVSDYNLQDGTYSIDIKGTFNGEIVLEESKELQLKFMSMNPQMYKSMYSQSSSFSIQMRLMDLVGEPIKDYITVKFYDYSDVELLSTEHRINYNWTNKLLDNNNIEYASLRSEYLRIDLNDILKTHKNYGNIKRVELIYGDIKLNVKDVASLIDGFSHCGLIGGISIGDRELTASAEVSGSYTKDDIEIYLIERLNDAETILAKSNESTYIHSRSDLLSSGFYAHYKLCVLDEKEILRAENKKFFLKYVNKKNNDTEFREVYPSNQPKYNFSKIDESTLIMIFNDENTSINGIDKNLEIRIVYEGKDRFTDYYGYPKAFGVADVIDGVYEVKLSYENGELYELQNGWNYSYILYSNNQEVMRGDFSIPEETNDYVDDRINYIQTLVVPLGVKEFRNSIDVSYSKGSLKKEDINRIELLHKDNYYYAIGSMDLNEEFEIIQNGEYNCSIVGKVKIKPEAQIVVSEEPSYTYRIFLNDYSFIESDRNDLFCMTQFIDTPFVGQVDVKDGEFMQRPDFRRGTNYFLSGLRDNLEITLNDVMNVEDISKLEITIRNLPGDILGTSDKSTYSTVGLDSLHRESISANIKFDDNYEPELDQFYKLTLSYDGQIFNVKTVVFTENMFFGRAQLINDNLLSNDSDIIDIHMYNTGNMDKIKDVKFALVKNPKDLFEQGSDLEFLSVREYGEKTNEYIVTLKLKEAPVGSYTPVAIIDQVQMPLHYTSVVITDQIRVKDRTNYTYIGGRLKEVTVSAVNLDNNQKYKAIIYPEQGINVEKYKYGMTDIDPNKPVMTINQIRLDDRGDVVFLPEDIASLQNGVYAVYFESTLGILGSCRLSTKDISLDDINSFVVNGGSGKTNSRSVSILINLAGCNQFRLAESIEELKNQTYETALLSEIEKSAAIREFVLSDGNGTKNLYLQLKDKNGVESNILSQLIDLQIPQIDNDSNSSSDSSTSSNSSSSSSYQPTSSKEVTTTESVAKDVSAISTLSKNLSTSSTSALIDSKIEGITTTISNETDQNTLESITKELNQSIKNLSVSASSSTSSKSDITNIAVKLGEASLKAIAKIENTERKIAQMSTFGKTLSDMDTAVGGSSEIRNLAEKMLSDASASTAVVTSEASEDNTSYPKFIITPEMIQSASEGQDVRMVDLNKIAEGIFKDQNYIDIKKEIEIKLSDKPDSKALQVVLEGDAASNLKNAKIEKVNIVSNSTALTIDSSIIKEKSNYNIVIQNKLGKNTLLDEVSQTNIENINYVDVDIFENGVKMGDLDKPVKLSLDVKDFNLGELKDDETIAVFRYNENAKVWEPVGGKYDPISGQISVMRSHLSKYTVMKTKKTITGVNNEDVKEEVAVLLNKGIITDGEKSFSDNITREEFVVWLGQSYGLSSSNCSTPFEDLDKNSECYKFIASVYNQGIISGKSSSKFAPEGSMTYEEAAVIIANTLTKLDNKKLNDNITKNFYALNSEQDVSDWAEDELALVIKLGIFDEKSTSDAKKYLTREEAAVIFSKFYS